MQAACTSTYLLLPLLTAGLRSVQILILISSWTSLPLPNFLASISLHPILTLFSVRRSTTKQTDFKLNLTMTQLGLLTTPMIQALRHGRARLSESRLGQKLLVIITAGSRAIFGLLKSTKSVEIMTQNQRLHSALSAQLTHTQRTLELEQRTNQP